jgi:hypothetical protein
MRKAARTLPFFGMCIANRCASALTISTSVDPSQKASPSRYENILWYPGQAAMERRKQAYLNEHPQIKSHSDRLLPDTYDASDDEMF